MAKQSLASYRKKRDFKKTPEPSGVKRKKTSKKPIFVVHKHAASHLHYDFRIEVDGVLKSWAVPKGIATSSAVKRLAIPTEDHPMDYATFEGVIPEGQYGAGTVMVWDKGTYRNIKEKNGELVSMKQCVKQGTIEIFLQGKKLKGRYALVRTKLGGKPSWLLLKMRDQYAGKGIASREKSAKSGRTMREIEKGRKK